MLSKLFNQAADQIILNYENIIPEEVLIFSQKTDLSLTSLMIFKNEY
ncbi:hypothetical protein [Chryseobacterium sp. Tr-659]|nr:hypothetical protein [Chryseobacterium sp. Tr-659]